MLNVRLISIYKTMGHLIKLDKFDSYVALYDFRSNTPLF